MSQIKNTPVSRIDASYWKPFLLAFVAACLIFVVPQANAKLDDDLKVESRPAPSFDNVKWFNTDDRSGRFLSGKVVLVNFWATWCPPCIEELPSIQKLWKSHKRADFEVVAVNVGEEKEEVAYFLTRFTPALEFPIVLDSELATYKKWQVNPLPTSFLVDRTGIIRYSAFGGRDFGSDNIRAIIAQLIEE